jgi:hypothetical protein
MTATDTRPAFDAADVDALIRELGELAAEVERLRAVVLGQSDTLDQALASRLDWWAEGYRAGFVAGDGIGAARAAREWKITVTDVGWHSRALRGPTYAELDRRRYPPNGRLSWLLPRLGDVYELWAALDVDGGQP